MKTVLMFVAVLAVSFPVYAQGEPPEVPEGVWTEPAEVLKEEEESEPRKTLDFVSVMPSNYGTGGAMVHVDVLTGGSQTQEAPEVPPRPARTSSFVTYMPRAYGSGGYMVHVDVLAEPEWEVERSPTPSELRLQVLLEDLVAEFAVLENGACPGCDEAAIKRAVAKCVKDTYIPFGSGLVPVTLSAVTQGPGGESVLSVVGYVWDGGLFTYPGQVAIGCSQVCPCEP